MCYDDTYRDRRPPAGDSEDDIEEADAGAPAFRTEEVRR